MILPTLINHLLYLLELVIFFWKLADAFMIACSIDEDEERYRNPFFVGSDDVALYVSVSSFAITKTGNYQSTQVHKLYY